jgi:hypothetical protein
VAALFGNLNVSSASFLDFGFGTEGTLSFGAYTARREHLQHLGYSGALG